MRYIFFPTTSDELFSLLSAQPECLIMAGGTDLLVALRHAPCDARPIICLERIAELRRIEELPDGSVAVGSGSVFSSLVAHPLLTERYPLLTQAAATVGGPAIRNMATIGGNIATASPAADSLPPLYLYDACFELRSAVGSRTAPVAAFITGPRVTDLRQGEIISRVLLPPQPAWDMQQFEKVGRRKSLAIAVASLAAAVRLEGDGSVAEARFAWGSVGPTIMRCPEAEAALIGHILSEASLAAAADCVRKTVRPIDDIRAGADYRRTVAGNLLMRLAR